MLGWAKLLAANGMEMLEKWTKIRLWKKSFSNITPNLIFSKNQDFSCYLQLFTVQHSHGYTAATAA